MEELKQTFLPGEYSMEHKPLVNLNSTENFLVNLQQNQDNENDMLIFEEINNPYTTTGSSQKSEVQSVSKTDDEIIMDLEVFLDLENVDELFNNVTQKENEGDDKSKIEEVLFTDQVAIEKPINLEDCTISRETEENISKGIV